MCGEGCVSFDIGLLYLDRCLESCRCNKSCYIDCEMQGYIGGYDIIYIRRDGYVMLSRKIDGFRTPYARPDPFRQKEDGDREVSKALIIFKLH